MQGGRGCGVRRGMSLYVSSDTTAVLPIKWPQKSRSASLTEFATTMKGETASLCTGT